MKKIKKFLLTIAMTMIFSVSAFAASGFEFILNVPFGLSVGFESVDLGMLPGTDGITQTKNRRRKSWRRFRYWSCGTVGLYVPS